MRALAAWIVAIVVALTLADDRRLLKQYFGATCESPGIACNGTRVHQVWLPGAGLTGPLPPFQEVELLNLANNELTGTIPRLSPHLKFLDVGGNMLTGTLPKVWPKQLRKLHFDENRLHGTIPVLPSELLQNLDLSRNDFTGTLPFVDSERLTYVSFAENRLHGTIPSGWGQLPKLIYLDLGTNALEGTIPGEWGRKLMDLILGDNLLTGTIPAQVFDSERMQAFIVQYNQLEGTIPAPSGEADTMSVLWLGHNALSGTIPKELFVEFSSLRKCVLFVVRQIQFL